jgi:pentose-5-phosphate-3-epimerase
MLFFFELKILNFSIHVELYYCILKGLKNKIKKIKSKERVAHISINFETKMKDKRDKLKNSFSLCIMTNFIIIF